MVITVCFVAYAGDIYPLDLLLLSWYGGYLLFILLRSKCAHFVTNLSLLHAE